MSSGCCITGEGTFEADRVRCSVRYVELFINYWSDREAVQPYAGTSCIYI
jgi:hypothetical protein